MFKDVTPPILQLGAVPAPPPTPFVVPTPWYTNPLYLIGIGIAAFVGYKMLGDKKDK